jgi:hypothetical protein
VVCNNGHPTPRDAVLLDAVSSRGLYFKPANAGSFVLPPCPAPDQAMLPYQFNTDTLPPLHQIPIHYTCISLLRPARRSKLDRANAQTLHHQKPRILSLVPCMIVSLTEVQLNSCRREAVMVSAPIIICSGYRRLQSCCRERLCCESRSSLLLTLRDLIIKGRLRYILVNTITEIKNAAC